MKRAGKEGGLIKVRRKRSIREDGAQRLSRKVWEFSEQRGGEGEVRKEEEMDGIGV